MKLPDYDASAATRPRDIVSRHDLSYQRIDFDAIPIIDISASLTGDGAAMRAAAHEIREACVNVGFFYVKGHGVPDPVIAAALAQVTAFFALPEATKLNYNINEIKRHRGFVPVGGLSADPTIVDQQEGYEVGPELPANDPDYLAGSALFGPNVWPAELPAFQPAVYRYFEDTLDLGHRLFRLFALALDIEENFFEPLITKPMAQLRLLYYPETDPMAEPEDAMGIGPHTDYEPFTMLYQTEAGLQVQNRAGQWVEAPPIPGTFIINIGDMLQRWSNDIFVSTPHRVINRSGRERYSMPLFFGTNHDCIVECLASCVSAERPAAYPPTHAGYWTENMHSYSYAYRWEERGKLPNPELGVL